MDRELQEVRSGGALVMDRARDLVPGAHLVCLTQDETAGIEGRRAGLELRDTILVLLPGPRASFLFLFRKPIAESTVAEQMVETGTGGINVNACRIATSMADAKAMARANTPGSARLLVRDEGFLGGWAGATPYDTSSGRWPPNVLLVHGPSCRTVTGTWECNRDCPASIVDVMSGECPTTFSNSGGYSNKSIGNNVQGPLYADSGGASRFYPQFRSEEELIKWLEKLLSS